MVLTAKFGCARLYSRIISPDVDSRRLNLQACYTEYQWIMAYAQKFNVQIFQEELGLCREMVTARVASAARNHFFSPSSFLSLLCLTPANRHRSFPLKLLPCHHTAPCTLHRADEARRHGLQLWKKNICFFDSEALP